MQRIRLRSLVGERTAGAFNGWTLAIDLPNSFARYALPYTRSVSPKGIEYEGRGVNPDQPLANSIADFEIKRDRPLAAAIKYVEP
jgi:C-terminal processing protease CtpA/Prc